MEETKEETEVKKERTLRKLTTKEQNKLLGAILNGSDENAKQLIDIMEDIYERLNFGGNMSFTLCCQYGRVELAKYLIKLGTDVNRADVGFGSVFSPLMLAVHSGNVELVQILIDSGANVNFVNQNGNSALSEAVSNNNLEIFESLVSNGVDIEKCGQDALIMAIKTENIEITKRLIELGVNVNYKKLNIGLYGGTPLHYACLRNNFEIVKILMHNGVDETLKNKNGKTAIEVTTNEEIKEFIKNYNSTKVSQLTLSDDSAAFYSSIQSSATSPK